MVSELNQKAFLQLAPGDHKEQLHYAVGVLLDSMGINLSIEFSVVSNSQNYGLELPGGAKVGTAELNSVYQCMSLDRERAIGKYDCLGRFDETALTWDVSRPWVDLLALELYEHCAKKDQQGMTETPSFTIHITHDVDRTTLMEPYSMLNTVLGAFGLKQSEWVPLRTVFTPNALIREIERLLDYELAQGIGSRFFLLSGPYGLGRHSTRTDSRWSSWRTIAKMIQEAGMEIGLHGSFAARDHDGYREEKERLEQVLGLPITTHRNHYLRFDLEKICSQLIEAGIQYDFSVGYQRRVGFRSGSAKIHRAFDLHNQYGSKLLSVPLIFMDSCLNMQEPEMTFQELSQALDQVKRVHGCVSLLFHPEWLLAVPGSWPFFKRLINTCKEMGGDLSGVLP